MPSCHFNFRDGDQVIYGPAFDLQSDSEALTIAMRGAKRSGIEVWSGKRYVGYVAKRAAHARSISSAN
jgi:hypothetical protein